MRRLCYNVKGQKLLIVICLRDPKEINGLLSGQKLVSAEPVQTMVKPFVGRTSVV